MKKIKTNCRLKTGDTIKIISGEKKGQIGKINCLFLKKSILFLEGIPPRIKSLKSKANSEAKKIELQIPIHFSNVMLWDKEKNEASKIGYKVIETKKYRYFKKSGNTV
jgi:large subunit ribosomal protein L24